jgi:hypothetical protein
MQKAGKTTRKTIRKTATSAGATATTGKVFILIEKS